MWKRVLLLFVVAACAGDVEDEETASLPTTPCERLRDHLVDLRLADAKGIDVEPHRAAMKQAMGSSFLAACAKDLTSSQRDCAIAAADSNAAAQCVTPMTGTAGTNR